MNLLIISHAPQNLRSSRTETKPSSSLRAPGKKNCSSSLTSIFSQAPCSPPTCTATFHSQSTLENARTHRQAEAHTHTCACTHKHTNTRPPTNTHAYIHTHTHKHTGRELCTGSQSNNPHNLGAKAISRVQHPALETVE